MAVRFSDSIEGNLSILQDLISEIPPSAQHKVRVISKKIVDLVGAIRKDHPRDPDAGLAIAFAVHYIAEQMTQKTQDGVDTDTPLIQLLS